MRHFTSTAWLLFRTHLYSLALSRRGLICLALACLPPAIAWFAGTRQHASHVVPILGVMILLQVIAPLIALTAGSSVVTEEVENRTITYIFTRPASRAAFFIGRLAASTVVSASLLVLSCAGVIFSATQSRGGMDDMRRIWTSHGSRKKGGAFEYEEILRTLPDGLAERLLLAAILAGAIYTLISAGLGVFYRRAMIISLAYVFAIEGFLANIPGSSQKLSVQFYLRGVLAGGEEKLVGPLADIPFLIATPLYGPMDSSLRLLGLYLLVLGYCARGIRRRQYLLTS